MGFSGLRFGSVRFRFKVKDWGWCLHVKTTVDVKKPHGPKSRLKLAQTLGCR